MESNTTSLLLPSIILPSDQIREFRNPNFPAVGENFWEEISSECQSGESEHFDLMNLSNVSRLMWAFIRFSSVWIFQH